MHHLASTLEEPFGVCWIRLVLRYHFWTPLRQNKAVVVSTTLQLPATEPRGTQAEPTQECCSLHDVPGMPGAASRGRLQYYQQAGHETKKNPAEPRQECCSLQIVLGMSDAHSKGQMQYYQHAGPGTNRNQCRTSAGMLLIT